LPASGRLGEETAVPPGTHAEVSTNSSALSPASRTRSSSRSIRRRYRSS
jgi:hypothetical protein